MTALRLLTLLVRACFSALLKPFCSAMLSEIDERVRMQREEYWTRDAIIAMEACLWRERHRMRAEDLAVRRFRSPRPPKRPRCYDFTPEKDDRKHPTGDRLDLEMAALLE